MDFPSQAPPERLLQSDERSDSQPDKKWSWQIVIHLISLSWLAPIITLLYLNISVHIIGPSVWCPLGRCSVYDDDGNYSIERASHNDHNMNGMLLFIAKGLEVWFTFVAGLLVFEAQKALRQSNGGLPSAYALVHLEFSDLLNLFNISKWTQPIREASRVPKHRRQGFKLCAFALLAFLMTMLVNLMGPATGVLILPTVQSIKQYLPTNESFSQIQSDILPSDSSGFPGCHQEDLENHRYACADYVKGPELDSMISFVTSALRKNETTHLEGGIMAESEEDQVRFLAFNWSSTSKPNLGQEGNFIVPNRQTLRMLSQDIDVVKNYTYGDDLLGQSLQISSQRQGPAILVSNLTLYYGATRSIQLGDNKTVRCIDDYTMPEPSPGDSVKYTKCIRVGTEWNSKNRKAGFSIGNLGGSNATQAEPEVVVYFSDKATYYGGDLKRDEHTVECLDGTSSADCDWERIFSDQLHPISSFEDATIVEWFFSNATDGWAWYEFDSYLQFGEYSVDYSYGNEIYSANFQEDKVGLNATKLVIDPLWMLAAWSVDIDGTLNATRSPAIMLQNFGPHTSNWTDEANVEFFGLNLFAMAQAMSLISYDSSAVDGRADGKVFKSWVTRRVWAYELSSRTSILGVVVVCLGMVTVVFRVIFAVCYCPGARSKVAFVKLDDLSLRSDV